MKYIFSAIKKNKFLLFKFMFLYIIYYLISVSTPYLSGFYVDLLVYDKNVNTALIYATIIICVHLLKIVIAYLASLITVKLNGTLYRFINEKILDNLYNSSILQVKKYDHAYLAHRVHQDISNIVDIFISNIINVFYQFILILICMIIIARININLMVATLLFIPFYLLLYTKVKKPLFLNRKKNVENENKFFNDLNDSYMLLEDTKIKSSMINEKEFINKSFINYFNSNLKYTKVYNIFSSVDLFISVLFQCVILFYGGLLVINNEMTIGEFTIVNQYFVMLISCLRYYLELGSSYQNYKVSMERIQELENIYKDVDGDKVIDHIDKLSYKNLSFHYEQDKKFYYDSAEFIKGKLYCIVGINGSGKTSLLKIITGIVQENVQGSIYYDDLDSKEVEQIYMRKHVIGYVPQAPVYRNITVKELIHNELKESSSYKEIKDIVNFYKLNSLFYNDQFDIEKISSKTTSELSGGEKQKISFLLLLIREPELVILDEFTSAMDHESKETIFRFIKSWRTNRIILCVTHDENLIEIADQITEIHSSNS